MGESPLWVTCRDVSRDITSRSTSFLLSKGPNICGTRGVSTAGVVVRDVADSSFSAALMGVAAVGLNMPRSIAEDTLIDLRTPLGWVSHLHTPLAVCMLVVGTIFPPI